MFLDENRPWRKVKVAERRAAEDFAVCMRDLTDVHYPGAERIRVVLQYLKEPGFTSTQIAWLLGYESATSFNHAFKRWTGRTPRPEPKSG